jgi:hypothetical protein
MVMKMPGCFVLLLCLTFFSACKKENLRTASVQGRLAFAVNPLGDLDNSHIALINQSITIYDSTVIKDSATFASPPAAFFYVWTVSGGSGCFTIGGNHRVGLAQFIFTCPGNYNVYASIYDSTTRAFVGVTDTIQVNVLTETLLPSQPTDPGDTLLITPMFGHSRADTSTVWINQFQLSLLTNKVYRNGGYSRLDINSVRSGNTSNNFINPQIPLFSFPYAQPRNASPELVWGSIDVGTLTLGVPATININWLGKNYIGIVTLLNLNMNDPHQTSFVMQTPGAIKVK